MRWIIYIAALALTLMAPVKRTDVGMLQPVEVISLQRRGEELLLTTDTQDRGMGKNLDKAVENLKETTAGTVYLDTAEYLLIYPGCELEAGRIKEYLKDNVRICKISQQMDLAEAALFLDIHKPTRWLKDWKPGMQTDELRIENGRFQLVENNKKKEEKGVDKSLGT